MITATTVNRSLSVLIATSYIIFASFRDDQPATTLRVLSFLIFPMSCIWFGDTLGSITGFIHGRFIDQTTPGWFVSLGGWILLVGVPLIVYLLNLES